MKFLVDNFIIIISIGLFIIFALIGYLVESSKKESKKMKEEILEGNINLEEINESNLEINSIIEEKEVIEVKSDKIDDDILNNYDNTDIK